jgi:type VI secretion system protein ImpH
LLPGSPRLGKLASLVRTYAGDELTWDLKLVLAKPDWRPMALGRSRLGWGTWIGFRPSTWQRAELAFDPASRTRFAPDGSDSDHLAIESHPPSSPWGQAHV